MNTKQSKIYSLVLKSLLVLFLSIPFILNTVTNQVYKDVKNVELNQNLKLPSFEGGNCLYTVSEVQEWIDKNQLDFELVPKNEKVYLLDSPKKILCLGKIIGSEQDQSKKVSSIEEGNLNVTVGTNITLYNLIKVLSSFIIAFIFSHFTKRRISTFLLYSFLFLFVHTNWFNLNVTYKSSLYFLSSLLIDLFVYLLIFIALYYTDSLSRIFRLNTNKIKRFTYREDITGLRAIAVLAIVLYHSEFSLFKGGYLGVDIFFLISGFLISNIILSSFNEGKFSFKYFYKKRILRIIPALLSTLLFSTIGFYFLLTPKQMIEYCKSLIASLLFYSNFFFSSLDGYISEPSKYSPLLHTWSLAIEEQFYIVIPLLIYIFYKRKQNVGPYVLIFILLSLVANLYTTTSNTLFYSTHLRVWELLLGVLVMIFYTNKNHTQDRENNYIVFLGFIFMIIPIFIFGDNSINNITPKLLSLLGTSLVILYLNQFSFFYRILTNRFFLFIGTISYSIYLFHQPLFVYFRIQKMTVNETLFGYEYTVLIIFTIFLSYLNYRFVEQPFRNNKFHIKIVFTFITFLFVVLLLFSLKGISSSGYSDRFRDLPEKLFQYTSEENIETIQDGKLCHNRSIDDSCVFFGKDATFDLIVFGDSHFRTLGEAIQRNSNSDFFNHYHVTGNGCMYLRNYDYPENFCRKKTKETIEEFINEKKDSVIVYGGRLPVYLSGEFFYNGTIKEDGNPGFTYNDEINKIVIETIEHLINLNYTIVLVYPIPEQGWNVPNQYIYRKKKWGDAVSYPYSIWDKRTRKSNEILDSIEDERIIRIYPDKIFCNSFIEDQCVGAINDSLFYYDDDHLSIEGAELLADIIVDKILIFNSEKNINK
jgi:peptidoglycan/LPS O-acetylase OafA/YrhL